MVVRRFAAANKYYTFADWLLYVEFNAEGAWRYVPHPGMTYDPARYGTMPERWGLGDTWSTSPDHTLEQAVRNVQRGAWKEVSLAPHVEWDGERVW